MSVYNFIFKYLYQIREFFGGFISENIFWLQLGAVALSGLFLWGLIYILVRVSYWNIKAEQFIDVFGVGGLSKRRSLIGWKQIQKRLASQDPQQWKIAILEADRILDEILKMAGYLGRMDDKLKLITPAQLSNVEDIKAGHRICHQIVQDPAFEIGREDTLRTIDIYKNSFLELNLIRE